MLRNLNKKHGTHVTGVNAEALDVFYRHEWPGNVRELRNVVERAPIMAGEGLIGRSNLPAAGLSPSRYARPARGSADPTALQPGQKLKKLEEAYIKLTLEHVCGNRQLAAEMLGISLRTLQNRIAASRKEAKTAAHGS